jgi:integrase/recombinase XerD
MKKPDRPCVRGPLAAHAASYRRELTRQGYSSWTVSQHLYLMAHLSCWMAERDLAPGELGWLQAEQFLAERRGRGQLRWTTPRALVPLLGHLRALGLAPACEAPAPAPTSPADRLLEDFSQHLSTERGLVPLTVAGHRNVARLFLAACAPDPTAEGCALEWLRAEQINTFVLDQCARRSLGSAKNVVSGLRVLMRFLHLEGYTPSSLVESVPRAVPWRDRPRSRALAPGDVKCLLRSCDRRTARGQRDFAILSVLSRLGLRAGEVASLSLDEVDWRAGEIAVCGKGGYRDRLPLPSDVGEAVADYCRRGRPRNGHRSLFLGVQAPYGPLSSSAVAHVVRAACRRAGMKEVGPHRLRYSAASAMRSKGAPLFEIGQVLRHRLVASTSLYAPDDLSALASIARPWPGEPS